VRFFSRPILPLQTCAGSGSKLERHRLSAALFESTFVSVCDLNLDVQPFQCDGQRVHTLATHSGYHRHMTTSLLSFPLLDGPVSIQSGSRGRARRSSRTYIALVFGSARTKSLFLLSLFYRPPRFLRRCTLRHPGMLIYPSLRFLLRSNPRVCTSRILHSLRLRNRTKSLFHPKPASRVSEYLGSSLNRTGCP
jgi:hypothetical protein